jgi:hypothetical protein
MGRFPFAIGELRPFVAVGFANLSRPDWVSTRFRRGVLEFRGSANQPNNPITKQIAIHRSCRTKMDRLDLRRRFFLSSIPMLFTP